MILPQGPAGIGVLLMITGVTYFQMDANLIDIVKFPLSSGSSKLLHGKCADSIHCYRDGEDK